MPLTIWRFTDGKAGHDSQSLGLCHALNRKCGAIHIDIPVNQCRFNLINLLFNRFPQGENLKKPDLVIGAGHASHLPMLAAARHHKCASIVLMKPSLPVCLFDYCLIPEHDQPETRKNIISTRGALNDIQIEDHKDPDLLLILIGGLSRHVKWDDSYIIKQINQIVEGSNVKNIIITGSPRTPDDLFNHPDLQKNNITLYHHRDLPRSKLLKLMSRAATIWVSADSISMIYEALSTGAKVGLISVETSNKSKIAKNAKLIREQQLVINVNEWRKRGDYYAGNRLNEADRCAGLLLNTGVFNSN